MIAVQNVHKSFKDVEVLRGVDLEVSRGSIVALLGSNGAGKTTLIRILTTLLKADGGKAWVAGLHHHSGIPASATTRRSPPSQEAAHRRTQPLAPVGLALSPARTIRRCCMERGWTHRFQSAR